MNVTVASWNLRDGFNDPERNMTICDQIATADPDVIAFPEALPEGETLAPEVNERLSDTFHFQVVDYNDHDRRLDRHAFMLAFRKDLAVADLNPVRLAGRSSLMLTLAGGEQILGAHYFDRTVNPDGISSVDGEARRRRQAYHSVRLLGERAIIAGDLNATHRGGALNTLTRAAGPVIGMLPAQDPQPGVKTPKLKRVASLGQRLSNMNNGSTLQLLTDAGFVDADPNRNGTKGPFQLDHIMVRGLTIAKNTVVGKGASDHKLVMATVEI